MRNEQRLSAFGAFIKIDQNDPVASESLSPVKSAVRLVEDISQDGIPSNQAHAHRHGNYTVRTVYGVNDFRVLHRPPNALMIAVGTFAMAMQGCDRELFAANR